MPVERAPMPDMAGDQRFRAGTGEAAERWHGILSIVHAPAAETQGLKGGLRATGCVDRETQVAKVVRKEPVSYTHLRAHETSAHR
eukprot:13365484-Alexandrium_andersonii.AAC.1